MGRKHSFLLGSLFLGLAAPLSAQHLFQNALKNVNYSVEAQTTFSKRFTPLWLNANRYGLSSVDPSNGYLRLGISHDESIDAGQKWRLGYKADFAIAYGFTSTFVIQQLYADLCYKKLFFTFGSKERPMSLKNQKLSSGSQTFGINSRPIPEFRIELPDYISISGKSNWVGFKGHFGYGFMTDGRWQEGYVNPGHHYAKHALYHSKSGYIRVGNEKKFPLILEGGLEMACQFGGTIYNPIGREGVYSESIKMGCGIKDFIHAIYGGGYDATDDIYKNAQGNTVGSWLVSLKYKGKDWSLRAYYDHYFEDHSQMFLEYGWKDGLIGLELTLPENRFVHSFVYEYITTKDQSGPVYHDNNDVIPDQISGTDDYYNHNLYQGWQHWGQAIGNPLFYSPLYNGNGTLRFTGTRFQAHHIGVEGNPTKNLNYRLLFTSKKDWGTYSKPYLDVRHSASMLAEINYQFSKMGKVNLNGWSVSAAFGWDDDRTYGNYYGGQFTIRKTGLLIK